MGAKGKGHQERAIRADLVARKENAALREKLVGEVPDDWLKLPLTRKQAKEEGLIHFFTGSKCIHGHLSKYSIYSSCLICAKGKKAKRDKTPEGKAKQKAYSKKVWADPARRKKAVEAQMKWRKTAKGRERTKAINRNSYKRNSEQRKASTLVYAQKRRAEDPIYRLTLNLRRRVHFLVVKQWKKSKEETSMKLVGCDIDFLRVHIESLFKEGMSWDNYGLKGWHVDHIRPCKSFDLSDLEQQKVCFNWRNLEPVEGGENMSKGSEYSPLNETEWVERMLSLDYEGELFLKYEEGNSY